MVSRPRSDTLFSSLVAIALTLLFTGCDLTGEASPQLPTFTVTGDLDQRIDSLGQRKVATTNASAKDFSVQGVIRVVPPTVNGEKTTASHLSFNEKGGDRVFVGYKIPGGEFGGGIDVFNAANPKNLRGINSLESTNLDVQEIADDPDEGAEYVAGAVATEAGEASPSVIAKLSFSGNSGNNITVSSKRLSANVAKSVVNAPRTDGEHDLYAVTDGNSIYRFNAELEGKLRQRIASSSQNSVELSSVDTSSAPRSHIQPEATVWIRTVVA